MNTQPKQLQSWSVSAFTKPINGLSLRLSERRLLLGFGDLLVINIILLGLILTQAPFFIRTPWHYVRWFAWLNVLWLVVSTTFNCYDLYLAAIAHKSIRATCSAALIVTGIYFLTPYMPPSLPNRRLYLFAFPALAVAGTALWRFAYAQILARPHFYQQALIIGAGTQGKALAEIVQEEYHHKNKGIGYEILGFVDDHHIIGSTPIANVPVLGGHKDLVPLVHKYRPQQIVVSTTHNKPISTKMFQAILECREIGIPITTMPVLYEQVTGRVPVEYVGEDLQAIFPLTQPASFRLYLVANRIMELLFCVPGLLLLGFLTPCVWLVNRFTNPGDIFYQQERVGKGGKPINVIKFRSMVMDAEKFSGAVWATENDPRITPLGRFLRKSRLDEIPQFINVLRGEMSIIGPRPERPVFVNKLAEEIPFYRARHAVKPGLTGWAQVQYRYASSTEDALIKLKYDLYYIKHKSFYLDFITVLKTIQVVLGMHGT